MFGLSFTFLGTCLVLVAATEEPSSCKACNLYFWDTWILAGRSYQKGESIGFPNDTVVPFSQQSRRGFVGWRRYYYLYNMPHANNAFQYAPGTGWPFECHDRLFNARLHPETFEIITDRSIAPMEPIFLECWNDEFAVTVHFDDFPEVSIETLERDGQCLEGIVEIRKDGVFAKRAIQVDSLVTAGKLLHMHRAEFYNETSREQQPLLQYTYGHPDSDLLLLPNFPIISAIRHGRPANVQMQWDNGVDIETILFNTSGVLFAQHEQSFLWAAVSPVRDIAPGEELVMDFGDAHDANPDVIQERAAPEGFFPESWLHHEKRQLATEMTEFALPKLQPGHVAPAVLKNGSKLSDGHHRVGFPDSIADTMERWAIEIGMLDHLKRYVFDKELEIDSSERVRFNNGTWWSRRFDSEWASNMHYIATDDDESNEQFFHALHRAGFDQVLAGIGKYFNLSTLTCFYPTYIVVNHCVKSYVHSDSNNPKVFNLIFPIVQEENSDPELILAEDDALSSYTPYRYERNAGILLGKDGMHGTAPTDYRDTEGVRVVVSVYMGDFSMDDVDVQLYLDEWEDPPYPNYWPNQLHHALTERVHWSKDDPSVSIGNSMPRGFPLKPPKRRKRRRGPD